MHTTTGQSVGPTELRPLDDHWLIHSDERRNYYLRYKPDVEWLNSPDAILNGTRADDIGDICAEQDKDAIVFAAGKYIPQEHLSAMRITFCQLPFAVRRTDQV